MSKNKQRNDQPKTGAQSMTQETQTPEQDTQAQQTGEQQQSTVDQASGQETPPVTENTPPADNLEQAPVVEKQQEQESEKTTVSTTPTTMQEIVAQVVTQTGPKVSQALADLINKTKASGDRVSCDTIDGFLTYIEEMKPGRQMQPSDGARHQVNLYRLIQFFVNTQSNDFNNLFATILKIVDEFKDGAFNGRYAFRFTESMVLNKNDINSFTRFMNLLTTASAVKGRQEAIRQIDFNRTLEHGFTDEGKQRVLHFFNK